MGDIVDLEAYRRESQYREESEDSYTTDADIDESALSYRFGVRLGRAFGRLERAYRRFKWLLSG